MKSTNMGCLTPDAALEGDCDFLSANLYARSVFGEDALANLSIERMTDTGTIQGHVRIRSKTQGIALSLGDKITLGKHIVLWMICDSSGLTHDTLCSSKRRDESRLAIDGTPYFWSSWDSVPLLLYFAKNFIITLDALNANSQTSLQSLLSLE